MGLNTQSCKTQYETPYEYEGAMITIGTGGGFTGQTREYTLLDNGQVFGNLQKDMVYMGPKLKKNATKQMFRLYHELQLDTLYIDKPGNMYHYLKYKDSGSSHEIKWGAYDANPPKELGIYFANLKKQLIPLVSQQSNSSKQ